MNKKTMMTITSLVLGGTLLFGTAFVNASQLSGYETYKGAVKDTKDVKNGTISLQVAVSDNGNNIFNLDENIKENLPSDSLSSYITLKSGNITETHNMYRQDGKTITKSSSSSQYIVMNNGNRNQAMKNNIENPEMVKSAEVIVDTLVGGMKDKVVSTDNGSGTKKVSIILDKSEVTPLFNALTSMAFIGRSNGEAINKKADGANIRSIIPNLQSEIKIETVDSTADINNNDIITSQVAKIVISGKDSQGQQHNIVINANVKLSNINSTTPDKVDLTGKQVRTITRN